MKKQDIIKLAVLSALVIIVYIPTFIWMIDRWSAKDTYYSHGFLVPLISGFIVWLKRKQLAQLKVEPSAWGWLLFISGILIQGVSALWRVHFSSGFSLLLVIPGVVLLSLGKKFLRELGFALAFLVFMLPLPLVAIAQLSFNLKIFAAQISVKVVNLIGVPAIRQGSVIRTMHSYLMVEDPCSGIRSLIALIALGALMAYFASISRIKKIALFVSSVPIAIASNVVRIVSLSLVSEMYGAKWSTGFFHDMMGILVFVFAFVGLTLVNKILE